MITINPFTKVALPTPCESELLAHLAQENSEVCKEAMKAQSYGMLSSDPSGPVLTNKDALETEIADVFAVINLMAKKGMIDLEKIQAMVPKRTEKKMKWLIHHDSDNPEVAP